MTTIEVGRYLRLDLDHPAEGDLQRAVDRLVREHGLPFIAGTRPRRFHRAAVEEWTLAQSGASDSPSEGKRTSQQRQAGSTARGSPGGSRPGRKKEPRKRQPAGHIKDGSEDKSW